MKPEREGGIVNPPPICDNCKRVVDRTERIAILRDGTTAYQRELCSACRVHVLDSFTEAAPWLHPMTVGGRR